MKIKSYILAFVLFVFGSIPFTSCNYLNVDEYFYDMTGLDSVFARKSLLEKYLIGAASYLPDESKVYSLTPDPFQVSSDENFLSWNDGDHASSSYLRDELNQYTGPFSDWYLYYKGIRKANLILERMNEVQDMSEMDKRDFAGKTYFLRGYYYYLLLRQFGPVAIVPEKAFAADAPLDEMSVPRSTYDESVEYICKDMNAAASLLNTTRPMTDQYHQPTKGAALALISRIRLEQASPWFNGNIAYNDWKTRDGKFYISQVKDKNRWAVAALAAKKVMNMNNQYALHTVLKNSDTPKLPGNVPSDAFPNGAGNIDPLRSYSEMFNGETQIFNNPEFIYSCPMYLGGKSSVWIATPGALGGGNGLNLTQGLVDDYRMVDGRDINDSSTEFPYPTNEEASKPSGENITFSKYELKPQVAKMYVNREARFYATLGFSHCFWPGSSYLGTEVGFKNVEVTYYKDGTAAPDPGLPDDRSFSGYTNKKYIHPEDNFRGVIRGKVFPIIRYAEILLNYAEALNEIEAPYTDPETKETISRNVDEIKMAFNQVRYRAGLPGLSDDELDRDVIRELIKRERKIEFVGERKRFFDLRRWGDAMKVLNQPIVGMNVEAKGNERDKYYTRTVMTYKQAQRVFLFKMNFFPIHQNTLLKNPNLDQNPDW